MFCRISRVAALLVVVQAGTVRLWAQAVETPAGEVPALVKTLDTGVQEWRRSVGFACTYKFAARFARSWEDGLQGKFFVPDFAKQGKTEENGSGLFVKTPDGVVRFSYSGSGVALDMGVANGVYAILRPRQVLEDGTLIGGSVWFHRATSYTRGWPGFPIVDKNVPDPLSVCGRPEREPFLGLAPRDGMQESLAWSVVAPEGGTSVVLQLSRNGVYGESPYLLTEKYTINTKGRNPFVEAIELESEALDFLERIQCESMVKCDNGDFVPRRIVWGLRASREEETYWIVRTWESDDLGRRAVQEGDFQLDLPDGHEVSGGYVEARSYDIREFQTSNFTGVIGRR